ncbi:MAG: mucoidy inhibitor MuiA family protein, partial [Myxococcales bacterium]
LQAELDALDDAQARAGSEGNLGSQYDAVAQAQVSREMALPAPDPKRWSGAFAPALQARLSAASQQVELAAKKREVSRRKDDVDARIAQLQAAAQRGEYVAEVAVNCPAGKSAEVALSYVVGGASWSPAYEARAAEAQSQVELSTFATVRQSTGEDWRGARIVLSTAVPAQDATIPEIRRLEVGAQKREETKKVLVRRDEVIQHAQVGSSAGVSSESTVRAVSQGVSVQLEVPERGDVPGDGAPVRLFVGRSKLPARFVWRTVPAMMPFVFRVAEATNVAPFPLLPGTLDAFGQNGFLGRYELERVPQGGLAKLTFGVEERLKVKRVVVEEISKDTGLIRQRKRFRYAYRIELANWSRTPMQLELVERVPVSELEDVEVAIDEKTTAGYEHRKL